MDFLYTVSPNVAANVFTLAAAHIPTEEVLMSSYNLASRFLSVCLLCVAAMTFRDGGRGTADVYEFDGIRPEPKGGA